MRNLFLGPVFITITCPVEGIEPSKHPHVFSILCYVYVLYNVDHLFVILNRLCMDHFLRQTVCKDAANGKPNYGMQAETARQAAFRQAAEVIQRWKSQR